MLNIVIKNVNEFTIKLLLSPLVTLQLKQVQDRASHKTKSAKYPPNKKHNLKFLNLGDTASEAADTQNIGCPMQFSLITSITIPENNGNCFKFPSNQHLQITNNRDDFLETTGN